MGIFDSYVVNLAAAYYVASSNLQLLKSSTLNAEVAAMADEAVVMLAELRMDVEGTVSVMRELLHRGPLQRGDRSPLTNAWLDVNKRSERLKDLHRRIYAAVRGN